MKHIKKSTDQKVVSDTENKDYQKGFRDRVNKMPLDESQSEDYKRGWWHANWGAQFID